MHRRQFLRTSTVAATTLLAGWPLRAATSGGRIRIVQIGTEHTHAREKWLTLQRMSGVFEVAGIWEPDANARAKAAAEPEYHGARWLTEAEVFGDRAIQAAVVETELPDLLSMGRRCIEAGFHLHLDKPAGADLAGFVALQQDAARTNRVLQLGYMLRYHPAIRFCFEAQQAGWLGEIYAVSGDKGKVVGTQRRPWLAENYGGSMMLLGCHLLDLTVALLGRPQQHTSHRRQTFPDRDGFFDHEIAVLEYPRGLATIRSMLVEVGGEERRQWVVCGTKGTIEILPLEPARLRLCLEKPNGNFRAGWQHVDLPMPAGRYGDMMADFAGMVAGRPSEMPLFNAAHDALALELLLAVGAQPARAATRPAV